MNTLKKLAFAACVVAAGFSTSANASLLGDTIYASGTTLGPASAVIGSGIEFSGISNYIKFDFGADTLTLTSTANVSWSDFFATYLFSGFDEKITGFNIASNKGFYGNVLTNFSFTPNSISVNMAGGRADSTGRLVFNITTASAAVPEPTTVALFGLGLLGFAASRRKSAKIKNA
jgi:hypothetical protein